MTDPRLILSVIIIAFLAIHPWAFEVGKPFEWRAK
jgi:hypothetical protein